MKIDVMVFGDYYYQLELVEGLASGIQPHENVLRYKADNTGLINI
jgi:hypothetical protein